MVERAYIPETIDDVTPGWLSEVLKEHPSFDQAEIVHVARERLGDGQGFMGDVYRLSFDYGKPCAAPGSLVVKIPKLENRAMGEMLGTYERENMFFETLGADVPIRIPACYFGAFDRDRGSENQQEILAFADKLPTFLTKHMGTFGLWVAGRKRRRYILLIEDIKDAKGGDQVLGTSPQDCEKILQSVARTHAAFWRSPELDGHFWLLPQDIDQRMRFQTFLKSRESFKNLFPDLLEAGLQPYVDWLEARGADLLTTLYREAPETLVHSDLRLDNVLLEDSVGDGVVLLDWQLVRRGAAAYDVAYFLSGGLKVAEGPDVVDGLLESYHQALCDAGVEGYSFETFRRDYQRAVLVVLQTLTSIDQVELGEDRGKELMHSWMRRLLARLQGIDPDGVMRRQ